MEAWIWTTSSWSSRHLSAWRHRHTASVTSQPNASQKTPTFNFFRICFILRIWNVTVTARGRGEGMISVRVDFVHRIPSEMFTSVILFIVYLGVGFPFHKPLTNSWWNSVLISRVQFTQLHVLFPQNLLFWGLSFYANHSSNPDFLFVPKPFWHKIGCWLNIPSESWNAFSQVHSHDDIIILKCTGLLPLFWNSFRPCLSIWAC